MTTMDGPATTGAAPLDAHLDALVRSHFDGLMARWPTMATYFGIHEHDGRLADLSREAKVADIDTERAHLASLEEVDPAALSARARFERDLAIHSSRRRLFDAEVHRTWERRPAASDEVGDGLFLLLARQFAPLADRLALMTERLAAAPRALLQSRDRLGDRPVRLWVEMEVAASRALPTLFDEILEAGRATWSDGPSLNALERADRDARTALAEHVDWLTGRLAGAVDDFALGSADLETLVGLRAFEGLDTDDILAIGTEQLELQHEARRTAGRLIDPEASEMEVVDRVKRDGPADFAAALEGYRAAMLRARDFVAERDLATLPADDHLEVIATPRYLRGVMPFAAYFGPATFDRPIRGVYVVTPSVDDDPGAMLEHSWASIVNTSIHEAYPGHHHQLSAALTSATPARLLLEAPEFVEGWGMYCEQMMLEQGFEDTPERRVIVATDAIWRAARIVIDIRLHRGEMSVPEAIDYLVEHTGFERPNATAEVHRYTRTPTYNLSYLLGKILLLRLREDERDRLGPDFSLRRFHDALLFSGSLPISFHRRLLRGDGGGPSEPGEPDRA